jgi:hypothetical protein
VSDDLAGFGVPDFLPLATRRALHAEEIREHREAKEAEAERERRAEAHRSANLAMFKDMAEARGQHISAMELATGQVAGRTLGDIFAEASAMADMADAREAARERRDSGERLTLCIDSPPATRAETAEGREIKNTIRHFADQHPDSDVIDRAIVASEAAEGAAQKPARHMSDAGAASTRRSAGPGTAKPIGARPRGPAGQIGS